MTAAKESANTHNVITPKSSISIAFGAMILAGILANAGMMFTLKTEYALGRKDVEIIGKDVVEINAQLSAFTGETRAEIRDIRKEVNALRLKLVALESR